MEGIYSLPGFRDPISCFTHLFAAPVFAVLGFILVQRGRGDKLRTASLVTLTVTTVFLLSMSGVYHLLKPGAGRSVLRHLDIAGVFALIAGTVSPVHAILFRGFNRWVPLVVIWTAAIAGIALRTIYSESLSPWVGNAIFLMMGWGGLVSFLLLLKRYGFKFVEPLLLGGIAYTLGVFVMGFQWPTVFYGVVGPHEIWHVAVLAGLGLHWRFVFQFASGEPDPDRHQQDTNRTQMQ